MKLTEMTDLTDGGPVMDGVLVAVLALLLASGVMVVVRLARGPSTLDRAVALDALVAVVMAGIGVQTAVQHNGFYLPALLVLSFLGFTGSVGVARFMALRDEAGSEDADRKGGTTGSSTTGSGTGGGGGSGDGSGHAASGTEDEGDPR